MAQLQDCVKAVCNKCAQARRSEEIYHKDGGRGTAQCKEERMEQDRVTGQQRGKINEGAGEEKMRRGED